MAKFAAGADPQAVRRAVALAHRAADPNLKCVNDDNRPRPRDENSPTALNSADPARNFSLTVGERIRALTIGVPSWAARKRKIEDDEERYASELVLLHDKLAAKQRTPAQIDEALAAAACAIDLTKSNALVASHNRYYPIEANLPMDRQTGGYLVYGNVWKPEEPMTAERILARARRLLDARRG